MSPASRCRRRRRCPRACAGEQVALSSTCSTRTSASERRRSPRRSRGSRGGRTCPTAATCSTSSATTICPGVRRRSTRSRSTLGARLRAAVLRWPAVPAGPGEEAHQVVLAGPPCPHPSLAPRRGRTCGLLRLPRVHPAPPAPTPYASEHAAQASRVAAPGQDRLHRVARDPQDLGAARVRGRGAAGRTIGGARPRGRPRQPAGDQRGRDGRGAAVGARHPDPPGTGARAAGRHPRDRPRGDGQLRLLPPLVRGRGGHAAGPLVARWSETYDLVVRLLPDVALQADGVRSTNDAFRDEVEAIFDEVLPGIVAADRLITVRASEVTSRFDWFPALQRLAAAIGATIPGLGPLPRPGHPRSTARPTSPPPAPRARRPTATPRPRPRLRRRP